MFTNSRAVTVSCIGAVPWTALNNTDCIWIEFLNKYKHREIFLLHICLLRLRSIFSGRMCHLTIFSSSSRVRANTAQYHDEWWQIKCADSPSTEEIKTKKNTRENRINVHKFIFVFSREIKIFETKFNINSRDERALNKADVTEPPKGRRNDIVENGMKTSRKIKRKMLLKLFFSTSFLHFNAIHRRLNEKKVLARRFEFYLTIVGSTTAGFSSGQEQWILLWMMLFHQNECAFIFVWMLPSSCFPPFCVTTPIRRWEKDALFKIMFAARRSIQFIKIN